MRISYLISDVVSSSLRTEGVVRFRVGCILTACFYALLRGWLAFLCLRPLVGLGRISYPLYLIHQHIGFVIMFKADAAGLSPNLGFAAAVASVLLLAALINRYFDGPAHTWNLAWGRGRIWDEHTD